MQYDRRWVCTPILRELLPLSLMENTSYHARGRERDQQDEEYVVSSALWHRGECTFPVGDQLQKDARI
jgi:hypothetical protein